MPDITDVRIEDSMGDGTRWLTYENRGAALGITSESAKRLAIRHKCPRRPGNDGRALVEVPEEPMQDAAQAGAGDSSEDDTNDAAPGIAGDVAYDGRSDARALIGCLERRVEELTDDLADTRNELQAAHFEADALRAQPRRADVLLAPVEAREDYVRQGGVVWSGVHRGLLTGGRLRCRSRSPAARRCGRPWFRSTWCDAGAATRRFVRAGWLRRGA